MAVKYVDRDAGSENIYDKRIYYNYEYSQE